MSNSTRLIFFQPFKTNSRHQFQALTEGGLKGKVQKANNTRSSQAVSHPSTILAQCCLTSVIGRELVYSTWYGRWRGNRLNDQLMNEFFTQETVSSTKHLKAQTPRPSSSNCKWLLDSIYPKSFWTFESSRGSVLSRGPWSGPRRCTAGRLKAPKICVKCKTKASPLTREIKISN